MKIAKLKKVRVGVSLIFFAFIFFLFIDYGNTFDKPVVQTVLYLQFVPSLIKFLNVLSLTSAGFIIIILLTLLLGRVYCSSVCPLGTFQDIIARVSWKFSSKKEKKQFFNYSRPKNLLRFGILGITVFSYLLGANFLLALLDPYSNFGRFSVSFAQPALGMIYNTATGIFEKMNIYWFYPAELRDVIIASLIIPFLMLGLVVALSFKKGRLFCNTVCPVGALLGVLSKFSIYKIFIETEACNSCGLCVFSCKAGCIDDTNKKVDFTRCVTCLNCFSACNKDAFHYRNTWFNSVGSQAIPSEADLGKRNFMFNSIFFLTGLMGLNSFRFRNDSIPAARQIIPVKPTTIPVIKECMVTPPGSESIYNFNKYCTACGLCVSACRSNVLQPTFLEYGWSGLMQPRMDYSFGYCNYDCKICGDVCPTQAISYFENLKEKQFTQIGKVNFVKENCIVHTEKTECGACSEHCPTKAVDMVPYENTGLVIPEVDDEICVGCGACEYACPTMPYKAIYVEGNPEHIIALEPKIEKLEEIDPEKDFPF